MLLVGTHKDRVADPAQHARIAAMLEQELDAWGSEVTTAAAWDRAAARAPSIRATFASPRPGAPGRRGTAQGQSGTDAP